MCGGVVLLYQHNKHSIKSNDPSAMCRRCCADYFSVCPSKQIIMSHPNVCDLIIVITIHNNADWPGRPAGNATVLILQMFWDQLDLSSSWWSPSTTTV